LDVYIYTETCLSPTVFAATNFDPIRQVTITKKSQKREYITINWRYQRRNQKPLIEELRKMQWTNEKGPHDIQWPTKHCNNAKDSTTRTH